jgi:hypothetical protein
MRHLRFDGGMPRDPYIREKYTREVKTARAVARDYFLNVSQGSIRNFSGELAPAVNGRPTETYRTLILRRTSAN